MTSLFSFNYTYLLAAVARKNTSSGASVQHTTCLRPEPVRESCAIFGLPFSCRTICRIGGVIGRSRTGGRDLGV